MNQKTECVIRWQKKPTGTIVQLQWKSNGTYRVFGKTQNKVAIVKGVIFVAPLTQGLY